MKFINIKSAAALGTILFASANAVYANATTYNCSELAALNSNQSQDCVGVLNDLFAIGEAPSLESLNDKVYNAYNFNPTHPDELSSTQPSFLQGQAVWMDMDWDFPGYASIPAFERFKDNVTGFPFSGWEPKKLDNAIVSEGTGSFGLYGYMAVRQFGKYLIFKMGNSLEETLKNPQPAHNIAFSKMGRDELCSNERCYSNP